MPKKGGTKGSRKVTVKRSHAKANVKNLKKTTKKGAYAKSAKKNFQKRRAPFTETKQQTDVLVAAKTGNMTGTAIDNIRLTTEPLEIAYKDTAGNPKELTILPLNSFMNMNQGFDESDMIGQNVFSKYLKCKLEISLPSGGNQIRHPCDMYLIHGFITQPIGNTLHTVPDMLNFTRNDYTEHIEEQLLEYFNQRSDKLSYIPKKTSNVKFLGYRKLKVKRSSNLGPDPQAIVTVTGSDDLIGSTVAQYGAHPVINMSCNWPMMRKTHYVKGQAGTTATPLDFYYPNYSWLPFVALYNPTAHEFLSTITYPGSGPSTNDPPKMFVRYNSIHYYTDS